MSASGKPMPNPGITNISPYVPGKSVLPGSGPVIKLSSNETPLGPCSKAVAAYQAEGANLARYPDGASTRLREAIGALYGLDPSRIICGAGSDELLNLLAHSYLSPGDEAIYSQHGFLVYKIAISASGATPVVAPETDLTCDPDAILDRVTERTKVVFIANPNNPTGTYVPIEAIRRLRINLPASVLLILDGAYAEYVNRNDYEAGIELVATTENTVMTRTFSKIYGLASLRLGWAYCPKEVAAVLNRVRGPFNVTGAAIAAGVAAIEDQSHLQAARKHNEKWLSWLSSEIAGLGLQVCPSVGNFLLISFSEQPGKTAKDADEFLNERRIVLRHVESYGLPNALRMSVGTADENRAVVAALKGFVN